ncbi:polysaccharide deacetylase family protein [Clostridium sp. 19966]|uniref:polysaccharide deacetylase family protein n=1 Tax=Clostridium sp. 19966 TaxID=2768166 RepID=UPI0028DEFCF0|nr:polysaccharide deacetylase family protein [Clostridium sp. 19966]MDT8718668.1 polysaccharide deacetylase family protein [Clostridium sp. 19966]
MKKTYKIIISIIVLVLCISVAFIAESNPHKISKKSASSKSKSDISQNNVSSSKKSPIPAAPEIDSKSIQPLTINGFSKNMTSKQYENLDNWKKQITELTINNKDKLFINGGSDRKIVCLTFDDGPSANITPKILDILKQYDVKASFFIIGNQISGNSALIKRIYAEGNLVLNHSYSHPELTKKSDAEITKEISLTEDSLEAIIGKKPAILRPPYGDINQHVLDLVSSLGYKSVIWSTDTFDWSQKESSNIIKNTTDNLRPGEIILMHCNGDKKATVEALPKIIETIKAKGYDMTTLDKLLNISAYK